VSDARQHVVLCEGYDDRSFWRGWLHHLGCVDPTEQGRRVVNDAWGRPVRGRGRFLFRAPSGSLVLVQPFHGRSNARDAVSEHLGDRQPNKPVRVLLNLDCDAEDSADTSAEDQVRGIARDLGARETEPGSYEIGGSLLHAVIWRCDDPAPAPGVPRQQTLERLAAASVQAAYPGRGPAVESWLAAEPIGDLVARSFAHSYFAKWYARHGSGNFYEALWQDERVAAQLSARLEATGAARVVAAMVAD
jgi:hypothetical protein